MTEEEKKKKEAGEITRREFLKDTGILVGGAAIGSTMLLAACAGEETTETVTTTQTATTTQTVSGPTTTQTKTVEVPGPTKTVEVPVEEAEITVLNPEGQIEPIELKPLAPRLDTLDGKTVWCVCVNFTATCQYVDEMQKLFAERLPNTTAIFRIKKGSYSAADPDLWDEIAAAGDAMVMAVGH